MPYQPPTKLSESVYSLSDCHSDKWDLLKVIWGQKLTDVAWQCKWVMFYAFFYLFFGNNVNNYCMGFMKGLQFYNIALSYPI